MLAVFSII